jgi:hypothetical protein
MYTLVPVFIDTYGKGTVAVHGRQCSDTGSRQGRYSPGGLLPGRGQTGSDLPGIITRSRGLAQPGPGPGPPGIIFFDARDATYINPGIH